MRKDHSIIFLILFITLIQLPSSAQDKLIRSVPLQDVQQVAIDRGGDVYVVTTQMILKFDRDGSRLNELPFPSITSFDTGNSVRLLAYNRASRSYTILKPSLSSVSDTAIDSALAIDPWLVCASGDYDIIILDRADWSVKKVNTRTSEITAEFRIDSVLTNNASFTTLRAYQNFIFLLDQNTGIHIFNSLGKKIKTIADNGIPSFNFLGQELYYYKDDTLHFVDLFSAESHKQQIPGGYESVVITDERMVGVKADTIAFFRYKP